MLIEEKLCLYGEEGERARIGEPEFLFRLLAKKGVSADALKVGVVLGLEHFPNYFNTRADDLEPHAALVGVDVKQALAELCEHELIYVCMTDPEHGAHYYENPGL